MAIIIISGTIESHDIESEIARQWIKDRLEDRLASIPYLSDWMLKSIISSRYRYISVGSMMTDAFLRGVYLGLRDHGCVLEDMPEACAILRISRG